MLTAAGMETGDAWAAAAVLLFADLRGLGTHGLSKLPIYLRRIQSGAIDARARPVVIQRHGGIALLDARNALGQVAGARAADEAVRLAKEQGLGAVFVRNSNHFGATAFYAMAGLGDGLIGLAMSNANPTMAPWGGRKALIGTNPLAFAAPTGQGPPFVLDMASSTAARGKIVMAAAENRPIPPGWALDAEGHETTDARAALEGMLAPLGGPKGSGLAIMIDILCGVLTGACAMANVGHLYSDLDRGQGIGHLVMMIEIARFMPLPAFLARMDEYARGIRACPTAVGFTRIYLPGELEHLAAEESRRAGVRLAEGTVRELNEMAAEMGIEPL